MKTIRCLSLFMLLAFVCFSQSFAAGSSTTETKLKIRVTDLAGDPIAGVTVVETNSWETHSGTTSDLGTVEFITKVKTMQFIDISIHFGCHSSSVTVRCPYFSGNVATITITPSADWFTSSSSSNYFTFN